MLFNSYEFIFFFLPIMFIGYFLLLKWNQRTVAKVFLVLGSLFFYSWWEISFLPLIVASILVNYTIGKWLIGLQEGKPMRPYVLTAGILFNVGLLLYFKYADFFIENINLALNKEYSLLGIALPLAISFFTFQQIAFLVDAYRFETRNTEFLDYVLFVCFFPQLIAGPIVHHKMMMPQFSDPANAKIRPANIALGLFIFSIGLFKKVAIADYFAVFATQGFDQTAVLTFFEAWFVSLSYTLQLYFDFSGYSDMAIGIGLLFNIQLPKNFFSPYKAVNIQDFWRRWHITLSEFLTRYIYIPLGGNRKGPARTYLHILAVFLISGFWHGAGWTFIIWGALHGLASVVHRFWNQLGFKMHVLLGWFITFHFVNIAWVFFRAVTLEDAWKVLKGMSGMNGVTLSAGVVPDSFIQMFNGTFTAVEQWVLPAAPLPLILLLAALTAAFTLKNSMQLKDEFKFDLKSAVWAAVLFVYVILNLSKVSEFIYFNF
ncbi:D-alanyl-lipoteichoic acid acyltransferase DltB (MBOAT superfamily) [Bacillus ectoiniformans]|uniref:MBOAT family O-acyltransferase n=1 Tax=Bacillus ectoiniformans TaxID=1494429 RepID=UPI001957C1ED|nr:MBOAT family protein [Bacillus ectoiniformans]MBM7649322.1 D-alanyl-lipoteichoic acid acyltransferase DltB (MBOAT superfamily) [Bacillus ectoiniformans]